MRMKEDRKLIVASTSPRRKMLLEEAGFIFSVLSPGSEEILEGDPAGIVVKNAEAKARSVEAGMGDIVIGADTIVVCNGEILGKPVDVEDARRMIELQLLHPQEVITGVCVLEVSTNRSLTGHEISGVSMNGSKDAVLKHLESRQWMGKAGAYGIQDEGSLSFQILFGERDNIVGMPMTLLKRLLSLAGFNYPDRTPAIE